MNTGTFQRPIICSFMLQVSGKKKKLPQHMRKNIKYQKQKIYIHIKARRLIATTLTFHRR